MKERFLNTCDVRKLDQLAWDRFAIPGIILMEHASLGLANHLFQHHQKSLSEKGILILCGKGNNGGDGFATARHLYNQGFHPEVLLIGKKDSLKSGSDAHINAEIVTRMGIPVHEHSHIESILQVLNNGRFSLYLDAIFGTGLSTPLRGIYPELILAINALHLPIIAVDVPSGLNSDTGEAMGAAIRAHATVTFAFAKRGFQLLEGPHHCGAIFVVPIGLPRDVMHQPESYL